MVEPTDNVWTAMSTARTIRRFTAEPVDDATLTRCLQAATWAPSGANAQEWRYVVLRSPELRAVVAQAAAQALAVIEPVYGMTRPADDDDSRRARSNRATYELHDRAGEFTSVLFTQRKFPTASELLLGGSIFPAMQNFLLAARAQGLGACLTSWASYGASRSCVGPSACPRTGCWRATSSSAGHAATTDRSGAGPSPTSSSSIHGVRRRRRWSSPSIGRHAAVHHRRSGRRPR